jgi:hypothetical protein
MNPSSKRYVTSPREVLVFRLPRTGRCRTLIDNITASSDHIAVLRQHGVGRYRLEWRDVHRWIVCVQVLVVAPDGSVVRARPKPRARRVPPPRVVPPPVAPGGAPTRGRR